MLHILENGKSWYDLTIYERSQYQEGKIPYLCGLPLSLHESPVSTLHGVVGIKCIIDPSSVCSTCILAAFGKGMKFSFHSYPQADAS